MLVPFVPTPDEVAIEMLKCANVRKEDIVLDLGAGNARPLIIAKKQFNVRLAIGVELDKRLCKEAYEDKSVEIICGDMLTLAPILIPKVNVLLSYLSTRTNELLEPYIINYGKKGLRVISHDFRYDHLTLYDVKRVKAMGLLGETEHTIYCYKL
ncbi:50S ribosomal protein L11 methyltransferase [Sulfurisphaera javensis]|uniref:50S ribosomal protein L11 methyltransferase n=1 Tax=Sulfurisphaera javensis TaxID=2049879 RepID=A0AAT9GNI3_9CREN